MRAKASAPSKPLKLTMFASILYPNLQVIGTEQCLPGTEILPRSWKQCGQKSAGAQDFYTFFRPKQISLLLISGAQFQQTALNCLLRSTLTMLNITTPSVVEVYIFFKRLVIVEEAIQVEALRCSHSY